MLGGGEPIKRETRPYVSICLLVAANDKRHSTVAELVPRVSLRFLSSHMGTLIQLRNSYSRHPGTVRHLASATRALPASAGSA